MDLISVLNFLIEEFEKQKVNYALIGGLALQSAGVTRATNDIDMLILIDDKDKVKNILNKIDFELRHESADVLNFFGTNIEQGRIDFIIAHRKYARGMLQRAKEFNILGHDKVKVAAIEDQIGMKVQSSSNDKERYFKDMSDILLLIRNNQDKINIGSIREYFKLFKREEDLEKVLSEIKNAWRYRKKRDVGRC